MDEHGHIPVLLEETLALLAPQPGETVVDCTIGRGGHAAALAARIASGDEARPASIIGFDLDQANLAHAAQRLRAVRGVTFIPVHGSFAGVGNELARRNLRADGVLADLGFASTQMDDPQRGFSFRNPDAPLDMRLDPSAGITAAELIAGTGERELADILFQYGEEPLARRIARKLAEMRRSEPIQTTGRLVEAVVSAYGPRARTSRLHPATRTFMALRIAVNDELGALRSLLEQIGRGARDAAAERGWLRRGARIGVISFHSLEDRMVKQAFADLERNELGTRLTKKPIQPAPDESERNPRARSAKLRGVRIALEYPA